ncbi:hypothetical protein C8J55DRAFT_555904 [Lentinula edodes]|uniref:WKF domain-containing protein n=1 Tax=Lentinula lateritia TaxID=40482 RepID=A0A9W9DZQ1_9AGAR|nr:hypothetical protein C8J55DRAFT_555904 [Lentinula edodes]
MCRDVERMLATTSGRHQRAGSKLVRIGPKNKNSSQLGARRNSELPKLSARVYHVTVDMPNIANLRSHVHKRENALTLLDLEIKIGAQSTRDCQRLTLLLAQTKESFRTMSLSNDEVVAAHDKKLRKEKAQKAKKAKSDESDFRPAENIARKKVGDIIEMELDRKKKKKKEKKDNDKDKDKEPVVDLEGAKEIKSFVQGTPEIEMVKQEGESEVISEKNKDKKSKRRERRRNSELNSEGAPTARRNKRKREESGNADTEDMQAEESKKKKSRNNTGFPDPVEEALLSDQARLALTYAFKQFQNPSKWKFMKARQNWIIRNWATDNVGKSLPSKFNLLEIPDSQMPLVLKYLSNVKGNIREHLMRTCESIISTEDPAHASVVTERNGERDDDRRTHPTEKATNPVKVLRAEAMLAMFMDETKSD